MTDQCKNCEARGSLKKCFAIECIQHESWLFKELLIFIDPIIIGAFNAFRGDLREFRRINDSKGL